jgi:predicted transcriptional regulator of viral defense system
MLRDTGFRSARGRDRLAAVLREAGDLVTVEDTARALRTDRRRAAKLLARWTEQGWLKRLRRGLYVPIPVEALSLDRTLEDPWVLVPELFEPGYVGGWSAAEHWGLTEQIFRDVCIFTTRPVRSKRDEIGGVSFVFFRIGSEVVFGTRAVWRGKVRVQVSDPHRTLVDLLVRPSAGGGIRHVASCLESYLGEDDADLGQVIAYADKLGVGSVFKRLGFLLERSDRADPVILQECRDRLTAGNAKLDPALASPRLISRWRLRVPARLLHRGPAR